MFVTNNNISQFIKAINREPIVAIPIMSDSGKHPLNSDISIIYVYTIKSNLEFIVSYNHYDVSNNITYKDTLFKNCPQIHVWDSKMFRNLYINDNIIDHGLINYLDNNSQLEAYNYETQAHRFYQNEYWKYGNINNIVPVMKHLEYCRSMTKVIAENTESDLPESFTPYNEEVIRVYSEIEKAGLCIDKELFLNHFSEYSNKHIKDNIVYTQYNMYTTTGRPSNSHGGIFNQKNHPPSPNKAIVIVIVISKS